MSHPISKPPVKPPTSAGSNPTAPAASVPAGVKPVGVSHIGRLRAALGTIDENTATPSSARSLVSMYYPFLNPKLTLEHLPRSLRPHPIHPENYLQAGSKWDLLFHQIGSTVKALQEAYALDAAYAAGTKTASGKAVVDSATAILERRVARLEVLAAGGPQDWVIAGSDSEGFFLQTVQEYDLMRAAILKSLQSKEDAKRKQEIEDDNGEAAAAD